MFNGVDSQPVDGQPVDSQASQSLLNRAQPPSDDVTVTFGPNGEVNYPTRSLREKLMGCANSVWNFCKSPCGRWTLVWGLSTLIVGVYYVYSDGKIKNQYLNVYPGGNSSNSNSSNSSNSSI